MSQQDHKQLFDFIHSIGPICGNNIFIIDNTGKQGLANGETFYQVIVKGGLRFDISHERDESKEGIESWQHMLYIHWDGPFNATQAKDILAVLDCLNIKERL